jgi:UDP-3-O-[3-hydroxymyristoyl] glucosamine N-acyltransferase
VEIRANRYSDKHDFCIYGASYIGNPRSNTAMFITKKIEQLLVELNKVECCLIFAETGMNVDSKLLEKHCFVFSDNPQSEYANFTELFYIEEEKEKTAIEYDPSIRGAFISKTAVIGSNAIIEPGVLIGPGVIIGNNARILSGAIIKNAIIGDNVIINEKAVVGANGFTMANDSNGDKIRIFSLGNVVIGNNVEIGAHDNVSRGSGGDTVIEDFVKIDAHVHIGHDVHLHRNVEITAGSVIGGFVEALEGCYIGINSVIRNRVTLGKNAFIGMGSTVTKSVEDGVTVVGNPARQFDRK